MEQQRHKQLTKKRCKPSLPKTGLASLRLPRTSDKTYRGTRHPDGNFEVLVEEPTDPDSRPNAEISLRPLPLHFDVRNHSPTGFAWGYGGSGPAQLALAVLVDATGNEVLALRHYQEFKRDFVAGWSDAWSITVSEIHAFIAAQVQQSFGSNSTEGFT